MRICQNMLSGSWLMGFCMSRKQGVSSVNFSEYFCPGKHFTVFFVAPKMAIFGSKSCKIWLRRAISGMGRNPLPTYSIIDSQSVKTTSASPGRGIDGRKTVRGRKRHIDRGHFLHVKVHAANTHDTVAGCQVFKETLDKYPSLEGVSAG